MRIDVSKERIEQITAANKAITDAQRHLDTIVSCLVEGAKGDPKQIATTGFDHEGDQWFLTVTLKDEVKS